MSLLIVAALVLLAPFLLVVSNGAPYVPTHRKQIEQMFDELKLQKGSTVVDLGSGDGVFLLAAAQRGYRGVGYEINPYLVLVSRWRTRAYRDLVTIKWRSFWSTSLPADTRLVFTFLAGPFMKRLAQKLHDESQQQSFWFGSVGFELPGHERHSRTEAVYLYKF